MARKPTANLRIEVLALIAHALKQEVDKVLDGGCQIEAVSLDNDHKSGEIILDCVNEEGTKVEMIIRTGDWSIEKAK